jgi:hypothetical protein
MIDEVLTHPGRVLEILAEDRNPPTFLSAHHGGAYSAWHLARLSGALRRGAILVHVDSHSDLEDVVGLVPPPGSAREARTIAYDIASYIVPALLEGLVDADDVYWVRNRRFPGEEAPGTSTLWLARVRDAAGVEAGALVPGPRPPTAAEVQRHVAGRLRDHAASAFGPVYVVEQRAAPVRLHRLFLDEVASLRLRRGRDVVLNIDEDTFQMEGEGPPATDEDTAAEIGGDAVRLAAALKEAGVRPAVVTLSASPGFVEPRWMASVLDQLLRALERHGAGSWRHDEAGRVLTATWPDVPPVTTEIEAARAASVRGDSEVVMSVTARLLARKAQAVEQQAGRAARGLFTGGGSGLPEQPSPVARQAQQDLNAAAEARILRALALARQGRREAAIDELMDARVGLAAAYVPTTLNPQAGRLPSEEGWRRVAWAVQPLLLRLFAARALEGGPDHDECLRAFARPQRASSLEALRFMAENGFWPDRDGEGVGAAVQDVAEWLDGRIEREIARRARIHVN